MYIPNDIIKGLNSLGLLQSDTVMIHSSYKSLGAIEGGMETLIKALCEYFSGGLLVIPTHSWKTVNKENNVFCVETTPACTGAIPNAFLKYDGVYRSSHPTHSTASYGKDAAHFSSLDDDATTPAPYSGCHGELLRRGGKILFLGCDIKHNTFIHAVEEWLDIPDRIEPKPVEVTVIRNGVPRRVMMRFHSERAGIVCENYNRAAEMLDAEGKLVKGRICDAECALMSCSDLYQLCLRTLPYNDIFEE